MSMRNSKLNQSQKMQQIKANFKGRHGFLPELGLPSIEHYIVYPAWTPRRTKSGRQWSLYIFVPLTSVVYNNRYQLHRVVAAGGLAPLTYLIFCSSLPNV